MSYLSLFSLFIFPSKISPSSSTALHHLLPKSTMMRLWSKRTSSLALQKVITPNYHKVLKCLPVSQNSDETKNIKTALLTVIAGSSVLYASREDKEDAKCCGIIGVVNSKAKENEIKETLLGGLSVLLSRGYDSVGVATIGDKPEIMVSKYASKGSTSDSFKLLSENSNGHVHSKAGIGHNRWATHGGKTDNNAHPHVDYKNRIALVHNGTINNYSDLRRDLEEDYGIKFKSETDSEVIAHLIGVELDSDPNMNIKDALSNTVKKLDGTWGIAIISKDNPDEIVLACNGSPMVIGFEKDRVFVASETSAFNKYTKNFISMKDGEIASITSDGCTLCSSRMEMAPDHGIENKPESYDHWTLYEALQQPMAIARALAFGGRIDSSKVRLGGLDSNLEELSKIDNMVFAACGTSLFASEYGAKLMRNLGSFDTCTTYDAAELRTKDLPKKNGGIIAVSQSGETRDTLKVLKESSMIPRLSIVNVVGSAIARETKLGVYLNAGRENAVASTKAFTTQVTVMALVALWFKQQKGEGACKIEKNLIESLQRLPISFGMAMSLRNQCKSIAKRLVEKNNCFVLGKGYGESVAMEGSLKLKEIGYIHAEGYSGGALKHGPFALINDDSCPGGSTPVILLVLDDEHANQMRTVGEQVKARGADLVIITDKESLAEGLDDNPIVIPSNGDLTALIGVFPLQMIAYELSLLKGVNPDTPKNLAKSVTTD